MVDMPINGMSESHLLLKFTHDINKIYMNLGNYYYVSTSPVPSYPRDRPPRLLSQPADPLKVLEPPPQSSPHE